MAIVSPLCCSSTTGTVAVASGFLKQTSLLIFARYQDLKKPTFCKEEAFIFSWWKTDYFDLLLSLLPVTYVL